MLCWRAFLLLILVFRSTSLAASPSDCYRQSFEETLDPSGLVRETSEPLSPTLVFGGKTYRRLPVFREGSYEAREQKQSAFIGKYHELMLRQLGIPAQEGSIVYFKHPGSADAIPYARQAEQTPHSPSTEADPSWQNSLRLIDRLLGKRESGPMTVVMQGGRKEAVCSNSSGSWQYYLLEDGTYPAKNPAPAILSAFGTNPEEARFYLEILPKLDFKILREAAHELGYGDIVVNELERRANALRAELADKSESAFQSPSEFAQAVIQRRAERIRAASPPEIDFVRDQIKKRFREDFQKNAPSFANFEDYKAWVMSIPEYRKIIEGFWSRVRVDFTAFPNARNSVLKDGIVSLHETGTSNVLNHSGYLRRREGDEAAALGLTPENYLAHVQPIVRPKSAYLVNKDAGPSGNPQYGWDSYEIPIDKILEKVKRGELYMTLKLGDATVGSGIGWYGLPIPFEDFPYLAAPFLLDAQQRSSIPAPRVIDYRKEHPAMGDDPKYPAVEPHFIGGLENRLNIYFGRKIDVMTEGHPDRVPTNHIEVQFWGPATSDLFGSLDANPAPSDFIQECLRQLGITLK